LLDSAPAIDKYAAAEAATARERIEADLASDDVLASTATPTVDLSTVLAEFDLQTAVDAEPARRGREPTNYWVDVGAYLGLSDPSWGESWRLVNRPLADGAVRIDRTELLRAIETAIDQRVRNGLPFELADDGVIRTELESRVDELRRLLRERSYAGPVDVVVPALFPPCMQNLIEKAERDVHLSATESFALMAFLVGIGMSPDEVVAFCAETSLDAEGIRYQTAYLADDRGTQYPPPTCETLAKLGICHNEDDHMRVAPDPLGYYETAVEAADGDLTDWRDAADTREPAEDATPDGGQIE
jgi:DNA primase large subunit